MNFAKKFSEQLFYRTPVDTEAYLEPCQISKLDKLECFAEITIFTKRLILDVRQGSEYASGLAASVISTYYRKACLFEYDLSLTG